MRRRLATLTKVRVILASNRVSLASNRRRKTAAEKYSKVLPRVATEMRSHRVLVLSNRAWFRARRDTQEEGHRL